MATGVLKPIARSRTLSVVGLYSLAVGAYAILPVWNDLDPRFDVAKLPGEFHAALTFVLGLLLVFRTNAAYNRWWEARTLWGQLVNASRNLAEKLTLLVDLPSAMRGSFERSIVAFPFALRDHLRSESELLKLPGFEDATDQPKHVPNYLVAQLYRHLGQCKREHLIDGDDMRAIDEELRALLNICGGCERIYKTRIVRSYRVFSRQCIALFLVSLPWGISNEFGLWTIPMTVITAYFMIGLETVAEHVEEPFGRDEDDLDLDGLCLTIQTSVTEIFGYGDPH